MRALPTATLTIFLGALPWAAAGQPAAEQGTTDWRVVAASAAEPGSAAARAVVENADGFGLEIEGSSSRRSARCVLGLPQDFSGELRSDRPLELLVDDFDPQAVLPWGEVEKNPFEDGGDFMEVARRSAHLAPLLGVSSEAVAFSCWMGLPGQSSPTRGALRQILEGKRLVVRYFLAGGGSGDTAFDLQGAAAAIGEALDLPLEPSARDHLQDELLAFRVDYRSTTCYLLAGKKNRKRCLEAVNECAQRPQDSVLSMLSCVEVE